MGVICILLLETAAQQRPFACVCGAAEESRKRGMCVKPMEGSITLGYPPGPSASSHCAPPGWLRQSTGKRSPSGSEPSFTDLKKRLFPFQDSTLSALLCAATSLGNPGLLFEMPAVGVRADAGPSACLGSIN